ncbi:MAG: homeodomain transcription factor ste12 [Bogoriella megaspora]|nr:MAG: homeodomain transcription factor ste12 [Bogoriella megaspora]
MPPQQAQQQSRSVAPETFLLDQDAQQSLPADSVVALQQVDNLKYFLISAPVDWQQDQYIRRFLLPTGEYISCVLWNNLFHISGTDIVRCLSFRFQAFGRPVKNSKKFEEGIFSDLRNLKSGTDASLEEPKSAFLDFLYKNNCIRTQKKQKVFYWYSVPHDRLFLDALERDLKREKMGQEPTTMAVSEPALSFEFDSSQSLFEQLTKAQQTNSSSFNANVQQSNSNFASQSTSPVMRAIDSMPPPSMVPQSMPPTVPEEPLTQMPTYTPMSMPAMANGITKSREQFAPSIGYDRSGLPISQPRHSSMPAYMEYSPAPSFVSSHYEDYSTRGISFEPLTPPQQHVPLSAEPAYIANEETGLYAALPDAGISNNFNTMMQLPPSNLVGPQFSSMTRTFPTTNGFSVIEGSPTYKQRRRRSSLSAGISAAVTATGGNATHQTHRPSDLRRSMSSSVVPVAEADESGESPTDLNGGNYSMLSQHMSRHGTPLGKIEDSPVQQTLSLGQTDDYGALTNGDYSESPLQHGAVSRAQAPVFRRARSATMMELGPYPQKSHSCPIPTCGRLFKRLEHLKRHKRTHEANKDGDPLSGLSEEDLEGDDEGLGSLEEESPQSDSFLPPGMSLHTTLPEMPNTMGPLGTPGLGGSQMIAAQNY